MNRTVILTGASGHVGHALIPLLLQAGHRVRALVLPHDPLGAVMPLAVEVVRGDVCRPETLDALFSNIDSENTWVVHAAGLVSIASAPDDRLRRVNVEGTRNVLAAAMRCGVQRFLYVSSVHALPEAPAGSTICEATRFDPGLVHGAYAKSKAEASQLVRNACAHGLDAVLVHPSGILGPGDPGRGHGTQVVRDYMEGRLKAWMDGAYDFVDVRDVAQGICLALAHGRTGSGYILSAGRLSVRELLQELADATKIRAPRIRIPVWMIRMLAPLAERWYARRDQPPLFTPYSVRTLCAGCFFSCEKARRELGFVPRPLPETIRDTVRWLDAQKK